MIDSADILYNKTGQVLFYDAPEGRPSSVVSVDVFNDINGDDSTAEFSPTGTVETNPNTTIDASCGTSSADPTKVSVAATTGITRDRRILITSAANTESEWVEVERVVSADAFYARSPLLNDYVTSDTVQGSRINFTVDATWVADESHISIPQRIQPQYRARVVYVVSGTTYAASVFFDLVRYPWRHSVVGPDVAAYSAGWYDRLAVDDRRNGGVRVIAEAARQVKEDLRTRALADYGQRNSDFVNGLVLRKAVYVGLHHAYLHGAVSPEFMAKAENDYWTYLDKTISITTQQSNTDGAATPTPVRELFER